MKSSATTYTHYAVRIAHQSPGRVRLRLPTSASGDEVCEVVRRLAGVRACEWSPRTRGLLVHFEPGAAMVAAIVSAAGGRAPSNNGGGATAHEAPPVDRRPALAAAVVGAFGELDRRVLA